jgi:hemolysin D
LRSPAAGTVQQLAVRAPGAVLKPAEPVLVVVPRDAALEVEAFVLNRDIGFVGSGQDAAVKVDTFEFTRYGLLPARVRSVSVEAVEHPQFGAVYPARVALERDWIAVGDGRATLAPGMAVQVEIRTGTRKIIDYFLSPLGRVVHDSIRER